MKMLVTETRLHDGRIRVKNNMGVTLIVAKTKYVDNDWGISYASTHVASMGTELGALNIASAIAHLCREPCIEKMREIAESTPR